MSRLRNASRVILAILAASLAIITAGAAFGGAAPVVTNTANLSEYTLTALSLSCANNGVAGPSACSLPFPAREAVLVTCLDTTDGCTLNPLELGAWDGYPVRIINVGVPLVTVYASSGVTELMGSAPLSRYQTLTLSYTGDRYTEIGRTNASGGRYSAAAGGFLTTDTAYFSTAAPVTRYVDPTLGSDVTCDGKGSGPASGGNPCAWAGIQRALDDVPPNWVANVQVVHSAGTFATALALTFTAPRGNNTSVVNIVGDCTTPQATFTTTGTGVANVVSSVGAVPSITQITFTPTVATGSIPNPVVIGTFWLRREATTASGLGIPSLSPAVLAASATGTTIVYPSGASITALATGNPRICPFATTISGSTTISAPVISGTRSLGFVGMKFTGASLSLQGGVTLRTSSIAASSGLTSFNSGFVGSYVTGTQVTLQGDNGGAASVLNGIFNNSPLGVAGVVGSVSGNLLTGTMGNVNSYMLHVGNPAGSATIGVWGQTKVTNFVRNDFFGSGGGGGGQGNAIYASGWGTTIISSGFNPGITSCSTPVAAFDVSNASLTLRMAEGAYMRLDCTGGMTGKTVLGATVSTGARFITGGVYTVVNTLNAGFDFYLENSGTAFAVAALPIINYGTLSSVSTNGDLPKEASSFSGAIPPGLVVAAGGIYGRDVQASAGFSKRLNLDCVVAGLGAGNFTVQLYDVTTATSLCSTTIPCACTGGTTTASVACTLAFATGDTLGIRTPTAAECATTPAVNVNAQVTH